MFSTAVGKLQRQLHQGEYDLFKYAPMFESDFIQITKRGEVIDVHNRIRVVTVGIASTSPILPLPDVMLLARPAAACKEPARQSQATKKNRRRAVKALELTRLLPLKFVRMSIHHHEKQQLRLKFATGRACYLQLCPRRDGQEDLFAYWEKLIDLLRPPLDSRSGTHVPSAEDMTYMPMEEEGDRRSLATVDFQGKEDQDQVSIRSLCVVSEVAGATSAAFAGGEETQCDSHKPSATPEVATPNTKPTEPDKVSAAGVTADTLSMAMTKSAPGQLSVAVAGAAVKGPGGSKLSTVIAGAASMSSKGITMALAGAPSKSSECPSSASLSPEASMIATIAGAEPASKRERADNPASHVPRESQGSEPAGRQQHVSPAPVEAHKSRRVRRKRKEKERVLRGSHRRRSIESQAGGDKILQKPSGRHLARQRDDKKEKGCSSPGGSRRVTTHKHKGVRRASTTKKPRTSHRLGRSSSTTSSGSTTQKLSILSSFLRNVKAGLTTKTVASPHSKDVNVLSKTTEKHRREAATNTALSGQGLERDDSVTSKTTETVTLEAHY